MGRTPCCEKAELKKGPWTTEEDQKLVDHIQKHGPANWRTLPKKAGLQRCGKSCRLRWTNYLRPDIKRGKFSTEEEETIIQLHRIMGNKWSAITTKLPGRTDNEIKNYWNTHIRKRLLRMGIDPVTHSPRLDLLDLSSILTSLQNPSLLNIPALLNLQTLLNPELLRFTPSQTRVQNNLTQSSSDSSFFAQAANQNESRILNPPFHTTLFNTTLTEHLSNLCKVKVEQIGFQEKNNHVISEPSVKFDTADQGSLYQATEDSNQSVISDNNGFSSVFPESCSFPASSLGPSLEDELDIESFFSSILEKLENPVSLNVCTS